MGSIFTAEARYITDKAKVDAARITQKSGNELRGAQSALQTFSAALSNRRAMRAAGEQVNTINENISRNLDAATMGTFQARIQAAEELGSTAAMAAAAGVGGSSIEAYNETLKLSHAIETQVNDRAVKSDLIAASKSAGEMIVGAVGGLNNNRYNADLDFTQFVDPAKPSRLASIINLGLAVGASVVTGNPQAGAAILGVREGQLAADRGDFDGASQAFAGAMQNGVSAARAWHKTSSARPARSAASHSATSFQWGQSGGGSVILK